MSKAQSQPAKRTCKRLIVVDDHPLIRRGLHAMINGEPDLEVCAEAGTHQIAIEQIILRRPDMATVDLSLGESDGLDLIKEIRERFPALPVLVISMHDENIYAERAFRAGARGYISKQQLDETLLAAIRCVLAGGQYMSPVMGIRFAQKYLSGESRANESPVAGLSDRELQVFRLIGEGKTTRQIAERFKLSIKTIETYREHLKAKLTLHSGADLARCATRWVETGKYA